jgi:protein TonB
MTAHTGTTHALHESRERGLLAIAIAVACALHAAALLIPLPDKPQPAPPEPPIRPPIDLTKRTIPPPPLPERPSGDLARPAHRPLLPVRSAPEPDPVVEPLWSPMVEHDTAWLPQPAFDDPPPPPGAVVLQEDTPGLILPRLVSGCGEPVYPEIARRAGAGGVVFLRALIDEEGEVSSIEILQEPPLDLGFTEAAVDAVSCRRYEPGSFGGRPVAVMMTVVVEFEVR